MICGRVIWLTCVLSDPGATTASQSLPAEPHIAADSLITAAWDGLAAGTRVCPGEMPRSLWR